MILDYFILSLKSIRKRRLRAWLTVIGIFIGITAVVSLISLGQGLQEAITSQFSQIGADKLTLQNTEASFGPPGSTGVKKLNSHDIKVVESVDGVDITVGRLIRPAKVIFHDEVKFFFIGSWPDEREKQKVLEQAGVIELAAGRLLEKGDKYKAVVTSGFAEKEVYSRKLTLGDKLKIGDKNFEIVGILKPGTESSFGDFVLVPESAMKEALSIGDEIDMILIQVKKGYDVELVSQNIQKALRKDRNEKEGQEDFMVQTPTQILETFSNVLTIVQIVLAGIAAISLLVGGIGIMNTMYTSVLERTRDIGIMKSIGARNSDILIIFLIESGFLGMIGGAIGVGIGYVLGKSVEYVAINFLNTTLLKAIFPWYLIVGSLLFSFFVGSIAGLLPAIRASKLKPVDALRYE